MLEGASVSALVVGGGDVGIRKARALLDAGATVRIVAPDVAADGLTDAPERLSIERRTYASDDIGDATLVIAATSSREVNARVARDARTRGRLVNVADAPEEGTFSTPAVHRTGDLVIAVTAGGVPAVAARVRDAIAGRFSERYAEALARLAAYRSSLLGAGERERWRSLSDDVIDADFCDVVEQGRLVERLAPWR